MKKCAWCGKEFSGSATTGRGLISYKIYCSPKCRRDADDE